MENTQAKLENAAQGLLMLSEADYPFDYFTSQAKSIDDNIVLQLAGKPQGTLIEKTDVDYLLRNMVNPELNSDNADKFKNLAAVFKQELTGITVYRVGQIQIDVFIIGITADGSVAGLRTKLIET